MTSIRQIRAEEGQALRDIRLRAIADTPTAFGISLAHTLAQTAEGWTAWATAAAEGTERVLYVAIDDERWVGIAGGVFDAADQDTVHLISMWVDPQMRGQGIGRRLIEQVASWAQLQGAAQLALWVTEGNAAAKALYSRSGFAATAERQTHPSFPLLQEEFMLRTLQAPEARRSKGP